MSTDNMSTGIGQFAEERRRQVEAEGFTHEHDSKYEYGQLTQAAIGYAAIARLQIDARASGETESFIRSRMAIVPVNWPFHRVWWKPSDDPLVNLVKAGALLAAEYDRLQGGEDGGEGPQETAQPEEEAIPKDDWRLVSTDMMGHKEIVQEADDLAFEEAVGLFDELLKAKHPLALTYEGIGRWRFHHVRFEARRKEAGL